MRRLIRLTLLSIRDLTITAGPVALVAIVLIASAYHLLDPQPPKRVVLATGPEGSAYVEFAKRYKEELAQYQIEVVMRPTSGARENLLLLRNADEDVDFAFVQGGASETVRTAEQERELALLVSLGSLFYEPAWIFYREAAARKRAKTGSITQLKQMTGWKMGVGKQGSGSPGLLNRLLHANLMDSDAIQRVAHDETPSVVELLNGELDAVLLVSAPESSLVQMLLATPGIRLFEFPQAEAYVRRYRFLSPVILPRGVADIARDIPPRNIELVAPTTSLVAREGTHSALLQLFVQAAARIHGDAGWIARAGQFPSPRGTEFPLAKEAERFYRSGPPFMQRHLPFWLANLIDYMWVAIISIIAVLIPLSRVVPPLYNFRVRSRIFRWYRHLRDIEQALAKPDADRAALARELSSLDEQAERIAVPLSYADQLYELRSHIALVRQRLARDEPARP